MQTLPDLVAVALAKVGRADKGGKREGPRLRRDLRHDLRHDLRDDLRIAFRAWQRPQPKPLCVEGVAILPTPPVVEVKYGNIGFTPR
eukprot:CAMPEP_0181250152 /NCGR_PEP_ID=MMETSP1096-20121128/46161_1 /TAXON_ID=156174 ORGANISM="Chrysochromulina ericina, Strain CCMP281" /NCGR_SAMPLE_ID=MMETSP1096 /ASSEMBLY_ACC=CAM_ASM_000453 /LENGTH=86 /DNA_ID=CAMNT_0023347589 /DNA_START=362 /DNA_END=623 /DNA_ORIENTATION=-